MAIMITFTVKFLEFLILSVFFQQARELELLGVIAAFPSILFLGAMLAQRELGSLQAKPTMEHTIRIALTRALPISIAFLNIPMLRNLTVGAQMPALVGIVVLVSYLVCLQFLSWLDGEPTLPTSSLKVLLPVLAVTFFPWLVLIPIYS